MNALWKLAGGYTAMRIGLFAQDLYEWNGGRDFYTYLAEGFAHGKDRRNLTAMIPKEASKPNTTLVSLWSLKEDLLRRRAGLDNLRMHLIDIRDQFFHNDYEDWLDGIRDFYPDIDISYYGARREELLRYVRKNRIEVMLPATRSLGRKFPIPWVGYIFDLQHVAFPENFTAKEIGARNETFTETLSEADVTIVNSKYQREEIAIHFSDLSPKVISLPFTPRPPQYAFDELDVSRMKRKYGIEGRYFIVSNQFWIHKSHITAFRALAEIGKSVDEEISLVCTGSINDSRRPNYFNEIMAETRERGIEKRIKILGLIPRRDQLALLTGAISVVQPTLYEGGPGGGSVYDAVSYGVPAIISNIPVNREIEREGVSFFDAGDSNDLARQMLLMLQHQNRRSSNEQLKLEGISRMHILNSDLEQVIDRAMER
jgi:glycosyltransferase involved in cell wall biosynthesis